MLEFTNATVEEREAANKSNSIAQGQSPFQHNVKFTVNDFGYRFAKKDDGTTSKNASPVLVTSIGDLFISTLTRPRINSKGKIMPFTGTFNVDITKTIAKMHDKNNGEILQAIVDLCKGKTLIVNRTPYVALTKDNRQYATSLVNVNYVAE
jgi:hypothetical protein